MTDSKLHARALLTMVVFVLACQPKPEASPPVQPQPAHTVAEVTPAAPPPAPPPTPPPPPACAASATWVTAPNPPQEIPGGGTDFCQFYQFGWQWFLYLTSPSSADPTLRNFEVNANFPVLQANGDSCTSQTARRVFFVRLNKSTSATEPFTIPERIGQAGGGATIYDQAGNVVYYEIRFDNGLCSAPTTGNLPAGTTEIKTSWRVIQPSETGQYYSIQATVEGVSPNPIWLGLVGFHLARSTAQHPEMVWLTFEHESNVPDCTSPQAAPAAGWSFLSAQCAACLASSTGPSGCPSCQFNVATPATSVTGTPSAICRSYRDGSDPSDNKAAENFADVDSLNQQIVGPGGILSSLPANSPMAIWQNYFAVGGLWVSDPTQSASSANQRGSLRLANTTMETTFQGLLPSGSSPVNCFGCHNYSPGKTASTGLSHIFDDIHGTKLVPAKAKAKTKAKPAAAGKSAK